MNEQLSAVAKRFRCDDTGDCPCNACVLARAYLAEHDFGMNCQTCKQPTAPADDSLAVDEECLRAAAIRFLQAVDAVERHPRPLGDEDVCAEYDDARSDLRRLAEHPADDGEPTDHTWIGCEPTKSGRRFDGPKNSLFVYEACGMGLESHWCATVNGGAFAGAIDVPTRGHVRRLAAALGIALNEDR